MERPAFVPGSTSVSEVWWQWHRVLLGRWLEACAAPGPPPAQGRAGTNGASFQGPRTPTHLACLMAPSRVLKSAPHSSTTQWKWAL